MWGNDRDDEGGQHKPLARASEDDSGIDRGML